MGTKRRRKKKFDLEGKRGERNVQNETLAELSAETGR